MHIKSTVCRPINHKTSLTKSIWSKEIGVLPINPLKHVLLPLRVRKEKDFCDVGNKVLSDEWMKLFFVGKNADLKIFTVKITTSTFFT